MGAGVAAAGADGSTSGDLYEQTRLERERALREAADGQADHRSIMVAGVGV